MWNAITDDSFGPGGRGKPANHTTSWSSLLRKLERLENGNRETRGNLMSNYILAYHGGKKPESPEEGAKHMAKWKAWIDGLGDAVVNPGTPLGMSKTVSSGGVSDDGGSNPLSGFSIVEADSMDAALEMAKACPFLEFGTIEVAEVKQM
jgi:hypothetical protein